MHFFLRSCCAGILAAVLGSVPALAHAFLEKSSPSVGSTVNTEPKILVLSYTEDLEVPFCTVTVTDGIGMNEAAGKPQAVPGHPNEMQVPLKITTPGKVFVVWHALSVDTHKTQGDFSFTVAG